MRCEDITVLPVLSAPLSLSRECAALGFYTHHIFKYTDLRCFFSDQYDMYERSVLRPRV